MQIAAPLSACPGIVSPYRAGQTNKTELLPFLFSPPALRRSSSRRKSCCGSPLPPPRLLRCRQDKWISASIPEIDSAQASSRCYSSASRRRADDLSLSPVRLGGGIGTEKIRAATRTGKKKKERKPKKTKGNKCERQGGVKQEQARQSGPPRLSRRLLGLNSLPLSGFIRNEAAIKLRGFPADCWRHFCSCLGESSQRQTPARERRSSFCRTWAPRGRRIKTEAQSFQVDVTTPFFFFLAPFRSQNVSDGTPSFPLMALKTTHAVFFFFDNQSCFCRRG